MEAFDWSNIATQPAIVAVVWMFAYWGYKLISDKDKNQKEILDLFISKITHDQDNTKQLQEINNKVTGIQTTFIQISDQIEQRMTMLEKDVNDVRIEVAKIGTKKNVAG